ncbi:MAG: haloalkane dehalogenase [Acidimicrobiia bacterium]
MKTLRTPDERFADLPDFLFEPHYVEVDAGDVDAGDGGHDGARLRIHYLDEGPADAPPVLLLHGEPSWSYLYRHMIPVLTAAGHRCVVPDLVGFGRSDKPTERSDYTYARHVEWMRRALFDALDLRGITFFGQDWGGLVGLRLVAEQPDRFSRVVIGNSGLPTGDGRATDAFLAWQKFSQESPVFPVGRIVSGGTATALAPEVIAAYDAPFPDDSYLAGARQFPALVPTSPDDPAAADNRAAWEVLRRFDRPFLCAFSDGDAITRGGEAVFLREVPGTAGQPHTTIAGGGHFLQEDRGPELARVIVDFIAATPT